MSLRTVAVTTWALCLAIMASSGYGFVPPERLPEGTVEEARMSMETSPPSQETLERWGVFSDDWEAVWNPVTKTPHRIYGRGIKIAESIGEANVADHVTDFVEANAAVLGIDTQDLRLLSREKHGARWYTDYQQIHDGLDVIGGRVHVRLKEDGKVTAFGSDFYSDVAVSTLPSLTDGDALRRASDDTDFDSLTDEVLSSRLVVLPVVRGGRATHHLAYEIRLRVENGPAIWKVYVDAAGGDILRKQNEIYYDSIDGDVTGNTRAMYIDDPDQEEPFADHYVTVTGWGQGTTGASGSYSVEAGTGGMREVTASLTGTWARVTNLSGGEASFSDSVPPGALEDILWDDSNSRADERNAFYHTGVAHAKINEIDPSFTGMDRQTPVRVNQTDYCNAFWDGNGMTFGAGSGSCQNLAMFSDVIYHEYGHGITDMLYRPLSPSGAMHEALSDYFACTITGESYIGEGIFPGGYFRNSDNNLRYPDDLTGEVHDDGRILAGALWDMRVALSPDIHLADSLFHYARYGKADNFFDYYYDVLETDDDDGDLSNGTPHFYEIAGAFGDHGIGPGIFIGIVHSPVTDSEDSTVTFDVLAEITSNLTLDPDSLVLYYSTGGGYTHVTMTGTGNPDEYSATIPAQSFGTTVDYYIYARTQNLDDFETDPSGAPASVHTFAIGDDSEAPVITHTPMDDQPDAGWPSTLTAEVTDNLGIASVMLEYTKNSVPQTPVVMTNVPDTDTYEGTFVVAASSGDFIEYRILATDASVSANVAGDPTVSLHTFGIATTDYYAFETGEEGWTHYAPGEWNDEWHLSTARNHTDGGGTSWKCGSAGGGDYGTHQKALLETPTLTIGEDAMLVFWHWIDAEVYEPVQGSGIAWDGAALTLMDSTGAGVPIDPVDGYPYRIVPGSDAPFTDNKPVYSGQAGWEMAVFDLSAYQGECKIRFKFGADNYVGGEGWYIDDVMVWSRDVISGYDGCPDDCLPTDNLPVAFSLGPVLPNPSPGATGISYAVPSPGSHVSIRVFDVRGRLAATLVNETKVPGRYTARWNGRDGNGNSVSPGIYFIRMDSRTFNTAAKVMVIR